MPKKAATLAGKPARGITPKQEMFCLEYLKDGNGRQAAIRAGYSAKSAQEQSSKLLSKDKVKAYLRDKMNDAIVSAAVTTEWVVERARQVVLKSSQAIPVLDSEGNPTGEYKYDSAGVNGALKILAKYLGMEVATVRHEMQGLGLVLNLSGKPQGKPEDKPDA